MQVLILMGSDSDEPIMIEARKVLVKLGINCKMEISSAHRSPERTEELVKKAEKDGCEVFICGAGMAAHLAGAVAAHTIRPVIGVPLTSPSSPLLGVDALLSTVQMPPGVPVATVAIDKAANAAWLTVQIMAISNISLEKKLAKIKIENAKKVKEKNKKLQDKLAG